MTLAARLRAALAAASPPIAPRCHEALAGQPPLVPAAVLIAVTDRAEPGLILTVRHDGLRAHAGQVAFPGGRIDPGDEDAVAAALREAEEEIALPRHGVDVVGTLDAFETISDYCVTPVLGVVPPDLPLIPLEGEVSAWFEVPLAFVLDPAHRHERAAVVRGRARRLYETSWNGYRIWGATAAMIANLGCRLGRDW